MAVRARHRRKHGRSNRMFRLRRLLLLLLLLFLMGGCVYEGITNVMGGFSLAFVGGGGPAKKSDTRYVAAHFYIHMTCYAGCGDHDILSATGGAHVLPPFFWGCI